MELLRPRQRDRGRVARGRRLSRLDVAEGATRVDRPNGDDIGSRRHGHGALPGAGHGRVRRVGAAACGRVRGRDGASAGDPRAHERRVLLERIGPQLRRGKQPMSSCRGRCCCGSTSAPASSNRSTSTSPTSTSRMIPPAPDRGQPLDRAARVTRSAPDRCSSSPSTASRTTSRSCPTSWANAVSTCRRRGRTTSRWPRDSRARWDASEASGNAAASEWHTIYTGFATQLWSCGGRDFDPDGRAALRRSRRDRGDRDLHRGAARRRPRGLDRSALVRACPRLRARPVRAAWSTPTTTSPSSRTSVLRPGGAGSGTRRRPQAQPASAVRTCGRGRWR